MYICLYINVVNFGINNILLYKWHVSLLLKLGVITYQILSNGNKSSRSSGKVGVGCKRHIILHGAM